MMQQNNGLDKRQMISLFVLSAIMMAFMFYFQNKQAQDAKVNEEKTKTEQKATTSKTTIASNIAAPINAAAITNVSLKNEMLTVEFSSLGGQISSAKLNQYFAYDKKSDKHDLPLYLINKNNSNYGFQFKDKTGKVFNTKDLVFVPEVKGNSVTMTTQISGATIQFVYTLQDHYTIDFNVKTQGLSNLVSDGKADFNWNYSVRGMEKGRSQEQTHSEFNYAFNNYKDTDYDTNGFEEKEEKLNWLGVKQQFFTSVIEAGDSGFVHSKGEQETIKEGEFLKKFNFDGQVKLAGNELNQNFKWYFMPLDLPILKSFEGKHFDSILPLGWSFIGTLNRWFFVPVYNLLTDWGIAAGWVIFLMTIVTKLVLSPVMYKQHKLSAMMKVVKPEIEEVNEKFKNADPLKKQQATMEIYRKAGINQMAGCLPALVQIPIFYALFRFFPNMIDLRGKDFWFVKDLTAYDDLIKLPFNIPLIGEHISIFAIACTIVILIYTIMTSGSMQQQQQPGMPDMRVMMYIFPVTFFFFLNTAPSGLSWYYFVSNALNILIILAIKNWILDEKKIHAMIQENKAKGPKPEGKFQKRMREMMEKAQEQQKVQEDQRRKAGKK